MSIEKRYKNLDSLRGVLASCVFFHHYVITYGWKTNGKWIRPDSEFFNNLGQISVSVFFMITAFLFTKKIILNESTVKWKSFYIGRFFRIYPMFVFSSLFVFYFSFYVFDFKVNGPVTLDILDFIKWLFFSFGEINGYKYSGLIVAGVMWTLLYETFFYLSLPILKVIFKFKISSVVFICVICFISINTKVFSFFDYSISSLMFSSFLFGGVVAYLDLKVTIRNRNILYSFIIIFLLCFVNYYFNTAFGFEQSIIIGLVFFMLIKGCDFFGLLKNTGLNYLGRISYSIYITHGIILYFLFSIIFPTICEDISFNQYMMLSPIVFIIVLLFSAFSSKYIEYPMMRYGQKLIKP